MGVAHLIVLAGAFALTFLGAAVAWAAPNATKRVAGIVVAHIGAVLVLAALGAPESVVGAAVAIALAQVVMGVAIVVRLQEAYGAIESRDVDVADDGAEPAEPGA